MLSILRAKSKLLRHFKVLWYARRCTTSNSHIQHSWTDDIWIMIMHLTAEILAAFFRSESNIFCGGSNSLRKRQTIKSWFEIHSDVRRGTNKNEVYISWVMTNVWFRFHNIFWIMFWTDYLLWMSEIQTLHRNTSVEICSAKMWNIKDPFLN